MVKATASFLKAELNNFEDAAAQQLIFEFEGNRRFVRVTSLDGYLGLNWLIVTVIPESDFLEHIRHNTYTTLALSSFALAAAIFIGAIAN